MSVCEREIETGIKSGELIHTADHGHAETRLLNVVVFHYFRFFLILTIFWNELECNEGLF